MSYFVGEGRQALRDLPPRRRPQLAAEARVRSWARSPSTRAWRSAATLVSHRPQFPDSPISKSYLASPRRSARKLAKGGEQPELPGLQL